MLFEVNYEKIYTFSLILIDIHNRQLIKMEKDLQRKINTGRWSRSEHQKFMDALEKYGRDWAKIQKKLKTRNLLQIRSHAQKVFLNMSEKDIRAFIGSDQQSNFDTNESKEKNSEKDVCINKNSQSKKKQFVQIKIQDEKRPEQSSDTNFVSPISYPNVENQLLKSYKSSDCPIIVCQAVNQRSGKSLSTPDKNQESFFLRMFKENQNFLIKGGNFLELIIASNPNIL